MSIGAIGQWAESVSTRGLCVDGDRHFLPSVASLHSAQIHRQNDVYFKG